MPHESKCFTTSQHLDDDRRDIVFLRRSVGEAADVVAEVVENLFGGKVWVFAHALRRSIPAEQFDLTAIIATEFLRESRQRVLPLGRFAVLLDLLHVYDRQLPPVFDANLRIAPQTHRSHPLVVASGRTDFLSAAGSGLHELLQPIVGGDPTTAGCAANGDFATDDLASTVFMPHPLPAVRFLNLPGHNPTQRQQRLLPL